MYFIIKTTKIWTIIELIKHILKIQFHIQLLPAMLWQYSTNWIIYFKFIIFLGYFSI